MTYASRTLRITTAMTAAMVFVLSAGGCSTNSENNRSVGQVLNANSPDGHPLRQIQAEAAPTLTLKLSKDSGSGWNLHLITEDFVFAPEKTGSPAQAGEGHAHLYLDGKKVARVYGPWFHLPAETVSEGKHTLSVSLSANDHTVWAVNKKAITAEIDITGGVSDSNVQPHDHKH
ncbi:hypothetical protein [Streptomyces virginiae]|uniref:hypothetical protein n=1 Tax=Streptomyces virginiae TaxID=1961 RepID=UPI00332BEE81